MDSLETYFAAARGEEVVPSPALLARVQADAIASLPSSPRPVFGAWRLLAGLSSGAVAAALIMMMNVSGPAAEDVAFFVEYEQEVAMMDVIDGMLEVDG